MLPCYQSLQPLVDVEDTIAFLTDDSNLETLDAVVKLVSRWRARLPSAELDDLPVWQHVVVTRLLCFERIRQVDA